MEKFYKTKVLDDKLIRVVMGKVMLHKFWLVLLVRVGILSLRESGGSTLWGKLGAWVFFWLVVCMASLNIRELRGKKGTPSFWLGGTSEVSTKRRVGRTVVTIECLNYLCHHLQYSIWTESCNNNNCLVVYKLLSLYPNFDIEFTIGLDAFVYSVRWIYMLSFRI